jgi:hypothetical protein
MPVQLTHIIDFFSVLLFDSGAGNASETRRESFSHGPEGVGGHRLRVDSRVAGCGVEAEKVFNDGQIRDFYPGPQTMFSGHIFVGRRQPSLRGIIS